MRYLYSILLLAVLAAPACKKDGAAPQENSDPPVKPSLNFELTRIGAGDCLQSSYYDAILVATLEHAPNGVEFSCEITGSNITLTYNETARTLSFGKREGKFPGMLQQRTFRIVKVSRDKATALDFDQAAGKTVAYNGEAQTVTL